MAQIAAGEHGVEGKSWAHPLYSSHTPYLPAVNVGGKRHSVGSPCTHAFLPWLVREALGPVFASSAVVKQLFSTIWLYVYNVLPVSYLIFISTSWQGLLILFYVFTQA